ncbi:MAG: hypothetical protein MPK11_03605, partial [Gammaproteobacteria bacterium]|nr:hypothetical protein [Gammaproteobacteria bacterium]
MHPADPASLKVIDAKSPSSSVTAIRVNFASLDCAHAADGAAASNSSAPSRAHADKTRIGLFAPQFEGAGRRKKSMAFFMGFSEWCGKCAARRACAAAIIPPPNSGAGERIAAVIHLVQHHRADHRLAR